MSVTHVSQKQKLGEISRKLIYSLALIPVVPATSSVITGWIFDFTTPAEWDELRTFHLLVAMFTEAAVIALWRRMVVWSLGRSFLTVLVGMIPYVQVAVAQGWWSFPSSGCIDFRAELLRTGQFHFGLGMWCWLLVWVWWSMEKTLASIGGARRDPQSMGAPRMPDSAVRILAAIGSIPFVFGLYWVLYVAIDTLILSNGLNRPADMAVSYLAGSVPAVFVWLLIWRGAMPEPARGIRRAIMWAVLLIDLPAAILLVSPSGGTFLEQTFYTAPVIGWGLWMALTPRLCFARWKSLALPIGTARERPSCPSCGYLLIGLTSTRCPECGAEPTLDELWKASVAEWQ